MRYITIVGISHYFGPESFRINQILFLEKDLDNTYDSEAIKVVSEVGVCMGYIANSIRTVAMGTHSAGRVYDSITSKQRIQVDFIVGNSVIARIVEEEIPTNLPATSVEII